MEALDLQRTLENVSVTSSATPSDEESPRSWTFSDRGYYDLTPPTEVSYTEDIDDLNARPIDPEEEPLVAVIGVGYVGEHLVSVFSERYDVLGYDVSPARVELLSETYSSNDRVKITCDTQKIAAATHFLISVPTLLLPDKTIDSSYLRSALRAVELHARPGATVVIESSVAVGMTRELLGPLAKERGFFAGMSPERVDPGRSFPPHIPSPRLCLAWTTSSPVVPVSRPEVAEMMKLYENCQRMVCIAYANEMADACVSHGIDPYEVCKAAASKPFGYMPYMPGLGVGGHCIPVNPYYLLSNSKFPLLQAASEKMHARPAEIARRAVDRLYSQPRDGVLPRVLVVGIGFKVGQSHLVNSPGLELAKSLVVSQKVQVAWADPLVKQDSVPMISRLDEADWSVEKLERDFDMIIVAFRQHGLDFNVLENLKGVHVEMWCN
ncbi:UDP-N-acetylglucosamine 6-dehydrogenase [Cladobotryum mycophilum]|uniref:UDP-N-acetylglucosamine 6-dehydrogenase n=1 Tax=Cladobotryum mycophilum TaxID=491253 RepID=A0ABR0SC37_9HYPO